MSIYAPTADYIWELIKSYDLDPEPLFRQADIDPASRFSPSTRLPRKNVRELLRLACEATGDESIGVRATERFHPSHMGFLGYAWLTSSTLRKALEKIRRYSRMEVDAFNLTLADHDDETHIGFYWDGEWSKHPFHSFAVMSLLVHLTRRVVGQEFCPIRVEFTAGQPADLSVFEDHFRCAMTFSDKTDLLVISRALLDKPLPRAHPELAQINDKLIAKYLAHLDRSDIISQVKVAVFENLAEGKVAAEDIAANLNVSVRTLRRRLEDEGKSFREMLSSIRHDLALSYIRDETLTLTEISYLLGFAEPSSFSRAYKGWTGISPTKARQDTRF